MLLTQRPHGATRLDGTGSVKELSPGRQIAIGQSRSDRPNPDGARISMSGGRRRRRGGVRVLGGLWSSRKLRFYHDDLDDVENSTARRRSSGCSPPPRIARRSWLRWRLASVDHELDDLAQGKIPDHVKTMCTGEIRREGGKGAAGVVGDDQSLTISPAAMAARRGRFWAAWRRLG